jgi:putative tryptophan/tyrosine transport system substrate-binding protein
MDPSSQAPYPLPPRSQTAWPSRAAFARLAGSIDGGYVMDRRTFLAGASAVLLAAPPAANAQPTRKAPTVGFFGPPPTAGNLVQAFQQGLRDLGYVEGQNIRIEYRYTDIALRGHPELFPRLATELVQLKPDVLVVSVTEAALAAKKATRTIPIVMVSVPDPVAAGLVASLARPGGNITGLSRQTRDLIGKTFQLLKEALPETARVDLLVSPADPLSSAEVADAREAAKSLGLKIVEARAPTDLEGAFSTIHADRANALLVVGGAGFYLNRTQIVSLALRHRLLSAFQNREFVEAGGLLSYAPSTVANYRRAAYFVDKILKGAKPADFPVEQPSKFELVINLKTAKALGLTIPPAQPQRSALGQPLLTLLRRSQEVSGRAPPRFAQLQMSSHCFGQLGAAARPRIIPQFCRLKELGDQIVVIRSELRRAEIRAMGEVLAAIARGGSSPAGGPDGVLHRREALVDTAGYLARDARARGRRDVPARRHPAGRR